MSAQFDLPRADNITRVELDNGIIVLVYENPHVESVVISGSLEAGSLFETPAMSGLASLTSASLMRGTQHKNFDELHGALEDIGADLSFGGGHHTIGFGGKALVEDLPTLLDTLNDVLRHPTFPTEYVDKLRQQRITELKLSQEDTRYRASRAFREMLYPSDFPYHHSPFGTLETLPDLTAERLAAFHQQHYGPDGMILCIVGAVRPENAVAWARSKLEDWQNPDQRTAAPALPQLAPPAEQRATYVSLPGKTQASIVMGTLGPARYADDYQAATLANSILGEFGNMGRIGSVIREQMGLAYYAYSRMEGGMGPGAWSVAAGVAPQNVSIAIEKALDEVRRLISEPVSPDDLADNQSYFTGRLPLRLESSAGIAATLQMMERYQLGLDYLEQYADTIWRLTPEEIQHTARQYLDPDRFVMAVAGPPQD